MNSIFVDGLSNCVDRCGQIGMELDEIEKLLNTGYTHSNGVGLVERKQYLEPLFEAMKKKRRKE